MDVNFFESKVTVFYQIHAPVQSPEPEETGNKKRCRGGRTCLCIPVSVMFPALHGLCRRRRRCRRARLKFGINEEERLFVGTGSFELVDDRLDGTLLLNLFRDEEVQECHSGVSAGFYGEFHELVDSGCDQFLMFERFLECVKRSFDLAQFRFFDCVKDDIFALVVEIIVENSA